MPYYERLIDLQATDVAQVGGKAANLGELLNLGIPVPQGIVVTTQTYREFMEQTELLPIISKFLIDLDAEDTAAVYFAGSRIKQIISATPWPSELIGTLGTWESGTKRYAVRSSATDEDSGAASFAGQHATFLHVLGDGVIARRIKDCFASLFEPRALAYRVQNGLSVLDSDIAVVVQEMIEPRFSGVLFTRDPNTGEAKTIIEVVAGLGEALVSGAVTPARYEVANINGAVKQVSPGQQERQLQQAYGNNPGTRWVPVKIAPSTIAEHQVLELAEVGQKLEIHCGCPQDVEYAIDSQGNLHILQTRPITTGTKQDQAALDLTILAQGGPASFGIGQGPVRQITCLADLANVQEGDVLITEMTTPDYVPVFSKIAGLVTALGGSTCHAAIVSREFNLPCVVGVGSVQFTQGQQVTVDGYNGLVYQS